MMESYIDHQNYDYLFKILVIGDSNTGKTTLMIEAAVAAQKMGVLPVFIITEMKWDFAHAQKMGFSCEAVPDDVTSYT